MTNLFVEQSHVPTIQLRPYQNEAAEKVEIARLREIQRGLIVMATGLGKTVLFADLARREHERGGRTLVIAHRNELLEQAQEKIQAACPSLTVDIDQGSHHATRWSDVIVSSIASIGRADSTRLDWFEPTRVVYDECHHCFPAGTRVDGKPIEDYTIGDKIRSLDHSRQRIVISTVTHLHRTPVSELVRITFSNGQQVVCTPSHPFFNGHEYVPAISLTQGVVYHEGSTKSYRSVQSMRQRHRSIAKRHCYQQTHLLLEGVRVCKCDASLSLVPNHGSLQGQKRAERGRCNPSQSRVLLPGLSRQVGSARKFKANGEHQPQARFGSNEKAQSNGRSGLPIKGIQHAQIDRTSAHSARRERAVYSATDGTRGSTHGSEHNLSVRSAGLGAGITYFRAKATVPGLPFRIQSRYRSSGQETCYRGRRQQPPDRQGQNGGRKEGPRFEVVRVDRVEILQRGSDGTFGGVCQDGHVYNLTVETTNNYFVDGLLVHNCAAAGAMNATRRFGCFTPGGPMYLGFTATPYRMDNKPLHGSEEAIFEEVLFNYPIKPAVTDGWLSDIRAFRARAGYSLDGIKTTGGDYNAAQLESRVNTDTENYTAFSHWADVAGDRQTIVFCAGVQHAHDMADLYNSKGIKAASVDGAMPLDERKAIISACKAGEIQVLTNCNVCTEGFDWPDVSSVLLLRPTKSWSLFVQMIGRGLRLAEGKEDCVVIDIVGSGDDKSLASVPGILGLPRGLSQDGCSMREAITSLDDLPDWLKARIMDREFGLDNLDSVLQEVNLLAELDPPDEVIRCSSFAWLKVRDDRYTISCGTDRISGLRRDAVVFADALGKWTAQLFEFCHLTNVTHCVMDRAAGNSLSDALRSTDRLLQERWPAVGAVVSVNAPWRKRTTKSDKQLYWLRQFGLSNTEIDAMDAGQVSAFLDRKFAAKRRR